MNIEDGRAMLRRDTINIICECITNPSTLDPSQHIDDLALALQHRNLKMSNGQHYPISLSSLHPQKWLHREIVPLDRRMTSCTYRSATARY
jgi:hypothetical protein